MIFKRIFGSLHENEKVSTHERAATTLIIGKLKKI